MICTRCGKDATVTMRIEKDGYVAHLCGKCVNALLYPRHKYPHKEIRLLYHSGVSKKDLAKKYGTNTLTISHILKEEE